MASKTSRILNLHTAESLSIGTEFKLPADLRTDHVRVVSSKDLCDTMACAPKTLYQLEIEAVHGPYKGTKNTIILPASCEVEIVKAEPKKRKPLLTNKRGLLEGVVYLLLISAVAYAYFGGYLDAKALF